MVTMLREAIGRMSCNPAIGGLAKGNLVKEIDALGGLMGEATDRAGIQFKVLNRSKGPAVQGPRAQCDRDLYAAAVQDILTVEPNLSIIEGAVSSLILDGQAVRGIVLQDGTRIEARAVIVTTGTFLQALMHSGETKTVGGRFGEPAAETLSDSLRALGLRLGRLKTGTPPRIDRTTVDFSRLEEAPGDEHPRPFSILTDRLEQPQVLCWLTYTGSVAHELIRANLHRAPMYSGQIQATGPRYCPSIEDKVVRFADKDRHQIFLEPEGRNTLEYYCNGISSDLRRAGGTLPSLALHERDLHLAPSRRAGRSRALAAWLRAGEDRPVRLRRGVRLREPRAARTHPSGSRRRGSLPRRPDQRHFRI
jgi:tRNA uridine 5-carboxymethylaminomethyl modification enzyme